MSRIFQESRLFDTTMTQGYKAILYRKDAVLGTGSGCEKLRVTNNELFQIGPI